jgi:hypothetical protein
VKASSGFVPVCGDCVVLAPVGKEILSRPWGLQVLDEAVKASSGLSPFAGTLSCAGAVAASVGRGVEGVVGVAH